MPHAARRSIAIARRPLSIVSPACNKSHVATVNVRLLAEAPDARHQRHFAIPVSGIIAIVSSVALVLIIVCGAIGYFVCWRRRRSASLCRIATIRSPGHHRPANNQCKTSLPNDQRCRRLEELSPPHFANPRSFRLKELKRATKNFKKSAVIGEGGFGLVFRGTLLIDDGMGNVFQQEVAVKRISKAKKGGIRGFQAELDTISILRHRNLVQLRGWGQDKNWLFLVYEYMANGSLDSFLHSEDRFEELNWTRRFSILTGLGSAIHYLHVECAQWNIVLHRDIKSSNVLLDEDFNAKLGDFGLSRQVETFVSGYNATELAGTRGYMAPEYCYTSKATVQSDVFSFGAVLAEVASGMKALDKRLKEKDEEEGENEFLLDWMWDLHSHGQLEGAIDRRLNGMYDKEEMKRVLTVALACAHPDPKERPTMKRALDYLEGTTALPDLPLSKPHYVSPMRPLLVTDGSFPLTSTASSMTSTGRLRNAVRQAMVAVAPSRPATPYVTPVSSPAASWYRSKPPHPPAMTSTSTNRMPSPYNPAVQAPSGPSSPYITPTSSPAVPIYNPPVQAPATPSTVPSSPFTPYMTPVSSPAAWYDHQH